MSMPTFSPPLRLRGAVLVAVAVLGIPVAADLAAANESERAADPSTEVGDSRPAPLLDLPGVDLDALGYDGELFDADVVDPGVLDRLASPLPDEPWVRVVELQERVDALPTLIGELSEVRSTVADAVDELEPVVERMRRAGSVAHQHQQEAQRRVHEAATRVRSRNEALGSHRQQMVEVAVAAYISPPGADALSAVLGGEAVTSGELAADVLYAAKADHDGIVQDGIEVSLAVGQEQLRRAGTLAEQATARVAEIEDALRSAVARRDAHRTALASVEDLLASVEERLPVLQADLDATIAEAQRAMLELAGIGVDGVPVVDVLGIRVHGAVAPALQALLAAAHADGVPLGGWGYRTVEQQVALRRAHCGPAPEDIFLKPASACSPPTAPPGASMHERGLAIDFHLAGQSITSRQSPGYRWLAEHGAAFGFYNLPSEPWHWSVNGQ